MASIFDDESVADFFSVASNVDTNESVKLEDTEMTESEVAGNSDHQRHTNKGKEIANSMDVDDEDDVDDKDESISHKAKRPRILYSLWPIMYMGSRWRFEYNG